MQDLSDLTHTVDGVQITPGLWVWNNNLDSVQVDPDQFGDDSVTGVRGSSWDGWYRMLDGQGNRTHIANGERMTTVFYGLRAARYPGLAHSEARARATSGAETARSPQ
jgi:hypothetical protein